MASLARNITDVDHFQHDSEIGVWLHPDHTTFSYSDGDKVERRVLSILQTTNDLGLFSSELAGKITDWPNQYHFSPARHNLLRHLKIDRSASVLELGAGCGAITRQLAESAGQVWAVEGSRTRAACAAARTRDLDNVRVFASDFQLLKTDRKFDVVTLIGVLEYAPVFFDSANPFLDCLKLARSFLKADGVLLLAIENQLGLKYFCGAPEDHTGKAYDGVQDLYRGRGVRTRGKSELTDVLRQAGFPQAEYQYPFPDYKLPSWVLTRRAFETPGFDPVAILRSVQSFHDGKPVSFNADERRIRSVLNRNGLLEDLSNSFLVLGSGSDADSIRHAEALLPGDLLASGYATGRRKKFNTQTQMIVDQSGAIAVHKSALSPGSSAGDEEFEHLNSVEPYRNGPQLEQLVVEALTRHGLDAALVELSRWIEFLLANALQVRDEKDVYSSTLKAEYFDCNPRNLIVTESGLEPIDLEWRYLQPLPLRTAVLLYLKPFVSSEASLLSRYFKGRTPVHLQLARKLGVGFTARQFRESSQQRRRINRLIVGKFQQEKNAVSNGGRRPSLLRRLRARIAVNN
jgi:SAM-dependent methyltransferase